MRGSLGAGSEVGTSRGAHFDQPSDLIIQVLADLLQCLVYALEVIVSEAPAAALLGVIITVAEYRPPCPHLLALSVNDAAVNTHAVATADLVVQYCVLRPADA